MLATKTGEVRFEDPHAAGKALSLDGQQYKGYNVKVQACLVEGVSTNDHRHHRCSFFDHRCLDEIVKQSVVAGGLDFS